MSPVQAGHLWALSTVGSKRHIRVDGRAVCTPSVVLSERANTTLTMATPACKRCLVKVGER